MTTRSNLILSILFMFLLPILATAQNEDNDAVPIEAIEGLTSLFDSTPLVALGETHEHAQLYDFLTELVQTEGFYTRVDDILIESGSALYQETLDRFISGQAVSKEELQKLWLNTTQSPVDPWGNEVYFNFLTTIRELNARIDSMHHIRVIAADPPIQWENVHSQEDYRAARGSRNTFYAQKAMEEVLKKNRKALMISGGAHFGYHNPRNTLVNQRIEKEYPNSVTVVLAASGLGRANKDHEERLADWHRPTLTPLADNWIGELPGPRRMARAASTPASTSSASSTAPNTAPQNRTAGPPARKKKEYSDYLLYFGRPDEIAYGDTDASVYISDKFWKEMNRRSKVRFGSELIPETRKTGSLRPVSYN
ncbi:MAG: hypothetical protein HEP71_03710 [Roseivirga sp.]|nr:hypothetical protein [Roseivirga sp.]